MYDMGGRTNGNMYAMPVSLSPLAIVSQGPLCHEVPSAANSVGPAGIVQLFRLAALTSAPVASKPSGVAASAKR
jgi:hypothetical protein